MRHTLLLFVFAGALLHAQNAHPRIFVNPGSVYRTQLAAKVAADDADWRAFKAEADYWLTKEVAPYSTGNCTGANTAKVCWTGGLRGSFEGSAWMGIVEYNGIAYQLTGNAAYANKVKEVLYAIRDSWDGRADCTTYAAGTIPPLVDSGYGWRHFGPALGWGYDWIHDQLSEQDKADLTATAACFFDASAAKLNPGTWNNGSSTDNYPGGYLLGVASIGYAMEGETTRAADFLTYATNRWDKTFGPSFRTGGAWSGGYPAEAYGSYGIGGASRILDYLRMRKNAHGEDLLGDIPMKLVTAMAHSLQPSRWRTVNEVAGSMPNGVMWGELATLVSFYGEGTDAGAYAQSLYNNLTISPSGYNPKALGAWVGNSARWNFLFKDATRPATDYRGVFPTYYDEGVDQFWLRSDWTDSAVWAQFRYGTGQHASHQMQNYGHISIARGADALLVHDAFWGGLYGDTTTSAYEGSYGTQARANALYFDDRGVYLPGTNYYVGGGYPASVTPEGFRLGMWAGVPQLKAKKLTATYGYGKSELTSGYDTTQYTQNATNRTLRHWFRSFVWLGEGYFFVFDRILSKSASPSYDKRLFWHLPPNTSPSSWTPPAITGNLATSAKVGNSKLVLNTVLPATAKTTWAYDPHSIISAKADAFGGSESNRQTMRIEVTDTADEFNPLTVILALGAGEETPAHGAISSIDSNHVGAYVMAASPRVAVFSASGSVQSSSTFTQPFNGTAQILVADMAPGNYIVKQDGVTIATPTVAAGEGTIYFAASCSGCTGLVEIVPKYAIALTSLPPGVAGMAYSQTLTTTGGIGPHQFTVSTGTLPPGLSLSSDGRLAGTPAANGLTAFSIQATDTGNGNQTTQTSYALNIAAPPLTIETTTLAVAITHIPYSQPFKAAGGNGSYQWATLSGVLPEGITLSSSGVLSGTTQSAGIWNYTVICSSSDGQNTERTYSLTVSPTPPDIGMTGIAVRGVAIR